MNKPKKKTCNVFGVNIADNAERAAEVKRMQKHFKKQGFSAKESRLMAYRALDQLAQASRLLSKNPKPLGADTQWIQRQGIKPKQAQVPVNIGETVVVINCEPKKPSKAERLQRQTVHIKAAAKARGNAIAAQVREDTGKSKYAHKATGGPAVKICRNIKHLRLNSDGTTTIISVLAQDYHARQLLLLANPTKSRLRWRRKLRQILAAASES